MAEVGAIFGHQGAQKANPYDHLKGIGAGTTGLAAIPQQYQTTLFPGGKLPEEPKTC